MKNRNLIRTLSGIVLLFSISSIIYAQEQPGESRRTSYLTYVYKLKTDQAQDVIKKGLEEIDDSFLSDLVHTYPTDSSMKKDLPFGSYLKVNAIGNKIEYRFLSISNVVIMTLNNGADLNLTLFDLQGNEINDAVIQLNHKKLKYDESIHAFQLKKNNTKGILKIEYEGVTTFFGLDREIGFSKFSRSFNSIVYSTPLKYITIPAKLVVKSPYDLYLSIKRRRPNGIYYYVSKPFVDIVRSISWGESHGFVRPLACIFDPYYCKDKDYEGFIAFNKPKYRPGDTVRVKAYILDHKQRLVNEEIDLWIGTNWWFNQRESKKLVKVEPYQPGFYESSFVLHDSLNLKLDYEQKVYLVNDDESLMHGSFYFEDYELDDSEFSLKLSKEEIRPGDSLQVIVEGKDANGLNVKDASVELSIKPGIIHKIISDSLYIDNTIWTTTKPLDPSEETQIDIPTDIFYDADIEYDVVAKFQTADFEVHNKVKGFRHRLSHTGIDYRIEGDSLSINLTDGDSIISANATIMVDGSHHTVDSIQTTLPTSIKINPLASVYVVLTDDLSKVIFLDDLSSNVEVSANRDKDSLHVQLANPRKLDVRYFLYKGNKEIQRGSGSQWEIVMKATTSKDYFISIQYVWAGRSYDKNYTISLPNAELEILTNTPSTVYPGKELDIQLAVTDNEGNPVEGVDITSYGIKKQFKGYDPPLLPDFSEEPKNRKLINNFNIEGSALQNSIIKKNLEWQKWNALMTLDSISYYQLIYPNEGLYLKSFEASESITQFAPYVVKDGELLPVHIIYLDEVPVYFSMTEHEQYYSFQSKSGYHNLKLRTAKHEIELDSIYIDADKKSILGVDLMNPPADKCSIKEKPSELTNNEQRLAQKYLSTIEMLDINRYVKQEDNIFWSPTKKRDVTIGPLKPYVRSRYTVRNYYDQSFEHEPGYHYEISNGLVKMTSHDKTFSFPYYRVTQGLTDDVLTEEKIDQFISEREKNLQANYQYFDYPKESTEGRGAIALWNPYPSELRIKNYVLFKENDPSYIRVYSGAQSIFHDLETDEYHTFALLFNDDYIENRSLTVKSNSALYLKLDSTRIQHSDSVSRYINEQILKGVKNIYYSSSAQYRDYSKIRSIYHSTRSGLELSGNVIRGRISDDTGEGLPGVNVVIKGTTFGTTTDLDGYYQISVPPGGQLVFSYVGFETQEVDVGSRSSIDVTMGGATELQEVVVTAMGIESSKQALGYSVSNINGALQGKVAGVQIINNSGVPGAGKVVVRGASSLSGDSQPLIVIDGVIYTGSIDLSPDDIASMEVIKGDQATALYGSQGANGVMLISLSKNSKAKKIIESQALDLGAFPDISQANPLRKNFSDYAFWEPKAQTDRNGIAKINVTFPDDITTWNTYFLAVKDNKLTGSIKKEIRSFKPIMATLSVPRFLIESDSSTVLGRVLNYTKDTLQVKSQFIQGDNQIENSFQVASSHMDSLMLSTTNTDTVEVKYSITTSSGYEDGELREIPVYKKGVIENKGFFKVLNSKEAYTLTSDSLHGDFTMYAKGNLLPVLMDEIDHVKNYPHACNEQKASKLLALVYEKRIREALSEEFKHDKKIKLYIKQLINSANDRNYWGWWPDGKSVNWITTHVLKALFEAQKEGFEVSYNPEFMVNELVAELHNPNKKDVDILWLLKTMDAKVDYPNLIQKFDTLDMKLADQLKLIRLKQEIGMDNYDLDILWETKKETMLSGMYWESGNRYVYSNSILTTIEAYKILDNEESFDKEKQAIINYLLQRRRTGYWRNTYESISIMEAILPVVMKGILNTEQSRLIVDGDESLTIDSFPYNEMLSLNNQITFKNEGAGPIFLTAYQTTFNNDPEKVSKDFTVNTTLDSLVMTKGEEIVFSAEITNEKDGEYVMVELPIPAGTSYVDRPRASGLEVHREYYRDRLAVFYESLPAGTHTIEVKLMPRYSGTYTINPAKVELMYFPTFYGREGMKKVVIK